MTEQETQPIHPGCIRIIVKLGGDGGRRQLPGGRPAGVASQHRRDDTDPDGPGYRGRSHPGARAGCRSRQAGRIPKVQELLIKDSHILSGW
jgi:hypothetical protein